MHHSPRPRTPLGPLIVLVLGALGPAAPAGAGIQVVSSDDRGIVLRLDVPAWTLAPDAGGRSLVTGTGLPLLGEPGRPRLPYAAGFIALPPGAHVSVGVEGAEESRDGVRLAIGDRPGFRDDVRGLGPSPTREPVAPIVDGPWPPSPVELGQPFDLRGQRLIALQIRPFRYDEATGRMWGRRSVTVRLSFGAGTSPTTAPPSVAVEDRHWDPVFRRAVLNFEQGRRWRASPASRRAPSGSLLGPGRPARGLARAAFDESQPEVRVRIDTTGVYGLEYDKLAAAGFPPGIPISQLSVHRHEFVGYGSPPYVTVELPIEVEEGSNRNGTFDSGDRIDVWVQSWAERSRASFAQRAWGDGEVVYVTYKPTGGLPIALRSGWRGTTPPVLPSYPFSRHWERNFYYFQFPPDTNTDQFSWTDVTTYYDRPDTFQFEVNQLDPARNVNFAITLQGRAEDAHFTWCNVENGSGAFASVVDSALWSGRGLQTYAASLPGTAFTEGLTNRMQVWGKTNFGPPDPLTNNIARFGVDYFEATYWRQFRALDHMLACNSGDAAGEYEIQAGGFASDSIRAYDVSDSLNPVRLTDVVIGPVGPDPHVLRLQDQTAGPPRAYAIFDRPRLLPAGQYTPVTRRQLYAQGSGDYLLIPPEAFLPAAQSLAALRRSEGLDVVLAPLESVCDEFNGGRVSSYAIRRFVRYAYDTWNASFVLLMGDGSEDPLHRLVTSGAEVIPAQKVFEQVAVSSGGTSMNEIAP
ncbi:MAG TPA: C25 family cysteine peptidase, partial [Candidatus Eisenbacteria bacterium]